METTAGWTTEMERGAPCKAFSAVRHEPALPGRQLLPTLPLQPLSFHHHRGRFPPSLKSGPGRPSPAREKKRVLWRAVRLYFRLGNGRRSVSKREEKEWGASRGRLGHSGKRCAFLETVQWLRGRCPVSLWPPCRITFLSQNGTADSPETASGAASGTPVGSCLKGTELTFCLSCSVISIWWLFSGLLLSSRLTLGKSLVWASVFSSDEGGMRLAIIYSFTHSILVFVREGSKVSRTLIAQ